MDLVSTFLHYHFGIAIHYYCIVGETPYVTNVKALNDIRQEGISNQTLFFTEEDGMYIMCVHAFYNLTCKLLFQFLLFQIISVS